MVVDKKPLNPMAFRVRKISPRPPTRWEFLWLCGLILSFCYELPVVIVSSYDRVNPRLFDVMMALGVLTVLPNCIKRMALPSAFKVWIKLVFVFVACVAIWFPFLPKDVGVFSLWFGFKYLYSLLCLYMVVNIPLTAKQKRTLMHLTVVGGLIVAGYAWAEYNAGGYTRVLASGQAVSRESGVLFSCLGPTYFHVAMYSTLSYAMALGLSNDSVSFRGRILWALTAAAVVMPALFCGARAGTFCAIGVTVATFWFMPRIRALMATALAVIVLVGGYTAWQSSKTYQRLDRMEAEGRNTMTQRLLLAGYSIEKYDELRRFLIPAIGGGFYVVPWEVGGRLRYSIGYGIHNSYLFALEQGGLAALFLFGLFILKSGKGLGLALHSPRMADRALASGAAAYFTALLVVALGGQTFWLMDGTVNLMYYQLSILMLAIRRPERALMPPAVMGGVRRRLNRSPAGGMMPVHSWNQKHQHESW